MILHWNLFEQEKYLVLVCKPYDITLEPLWTRKISGAIMRAIWYYTGTSLNKKNIWCYYASHMILHWNLSEQEKYLALLCEPYDITLEPLWTRKISGAIMRAIWYYTGTSLNKKNIWCYYESHMILHWNLFEQEKYLVLLCEPYDITLEPLWTRKISGAIMRDIWYYNGTSLNKKNA